MTSYMTKDSGTGGVLRTRPSDFIVDEVLDGKLATECLMGGRVGEGKVPLFVVAKLAPLDFLTLKSHIERLLGCRTKFCGMKDKFSISFQFFTARRILRNEIRVPGRLIVRMIGFRKDHLGPGLNWGNRFIIRIRGLPSRVKPPENLKVFPNYFSYQRFGSSPPFNHEIGRLLLRREFRRAAEALAAKKGLPEAKVKDHLMKNPSDPIGALRRLGTKVLRIYVQAYQSYLFNRILSFRIEEEMLDPEPGDFILDRDGWTRPYPCEGDLLLPVPGAYTKVKHKRTREFLDSLLRDEGVKLESFLIKEIPEASALGDLRRALETPFHLRIKPVNGDVILIFNLRSGAYATSLLREIIKPLDPVRQGFLGEASLRTTQSS